MSISRNALVITASALFAACGAPRVALAQTAPATAAPSPAPSPTQAAVNDPCTSLGSLVSRPTVTTSACATKFGDLLIETGYTNFATGGSGANQAVTYPQANLRVGLGHNVEFDLNPASIERISGSPTITGATDTSLGFKYEISYTRKFLYGVNVLYTVNSGDPATSANGDGVLANVNASYFASPAISLFSTVSYNAQSAGSEAAPQRYHGFNPSLGTSITLPGTLPSFFLEGFGLTSYGPGASGRYGFDTGFQKDIGSKLQLDVNYYQYPGSYGGSHLHAIGFGAAYVFGG